MATLYADYSILALPSRNIWHKEAKTKDAETHKPQFNARLFTLPSERGNMAREEFSWLGTLYTVEFVASWAISFIARTFSFVLSLLFPVSLIALPIKLITGAMMLHSAWNGALLVATIWQQFNRGHYDRTLIQRPFAELETIEEKGLWLKAFEGVALQTHIGRLQGVDMSALLTEIHGHHILFEESKWNELPLEQRTQALKRLLAQYCAKKDLCEAVSSAVEGAKHLITEGDDEASRKAYNVLNLIASHIIEMAYLHLLIAEPTIRPLEEIGTSDRYLLEGSKECFLFKNGAKPLIVFSNQKDEAEKGIFTLQLEEVASLIKDECSEIC